MNYTMYLINRQLDLLSSRRSYQAETMQRLPDLAYRTPQRSALPGPSEDGNVAKQAVFDKVNGLLLPSVIRHGIHNTFRDERAWYLFALYAGFRGCKWMVQ